MVRNVSVDVQPLLLPDTSRHGTVRTSRVAVLSLLGQGQKTKYLL